MKDASPQALTAMLVLAASLTNTPVLIVGLLLVVLVAVKMGVQLRSDRQGASLTSDH